ncbi:MAG TPA: hypothetical protein PKJ16_11185 [Spirochaetota bacterium]|nr:hypothetical protein [Spirochaetota bacterium]HPU89723.1 hypothetical protein [Spirochaetota bacterium]
MTDAPVNDKTAGLTQREIDFVNDLVDRFERGGIASLAREDVVAFAKIIDHVQGAPDDVKGFFALAEKELTGCTEQ